MLSMMENQLLSKQNVRTAVRHTKDAEADWQKTSHQPQCKQKDKAMHSKFQRKMIFSSETFN